MARIGVSDLYGFILTKDDKSGVTYDTAFRIAKAISITINPQTAEASLYADDGLAEYYSAMTAYDVTINIDDITPEMKGKLLGYEKDAKGMVIETKDRTAPLLGIAFRSKRSDGKYEYRQLFKVRFAPSEERYETQGENVNFQTPTITGKSMALDHNGWYGTHIVESDDNADIVAKWFEKPVTTKAD